MREASILSSPEDRNSEFRTMIATGYTKRPLINGLVLGEFPGAKKASSDRSFTVHPLTMWGPLTYTKYTWTRAVWLPEGQENFKEDLPVRSNYKRFLAWPAKQLCSLPSEGSNQTAFQSGPESPSAISRRGEENERKSMPAWQVTDNRITSRLVQKTARKSWVQTSDDKGRNARTEIDFSTQLSLSFFNFKI